MKGLTSLFSFHRHPVLSFPCALELPLLFSILIKHQLLLCVWITLKKIVFHLLNIPEQRNNFLRYLIRYFGGILLIQRVGSGSGISEEAKWELHLELHLCTHHAVIACAARMLVSMTSLLRSKCFGGLSPAGIRFWATEGELHECVATQR